MNCIEMYVSPSLAEEWLKKNKVNRPLNQDRVRQYARDMSADRWLHSHQGLAFCPEGDLLDGQHRLHAVIMSGKTIKTQVAFGVPEGSRIVIDGIRPRSAADSINMEGGQVTYKVVAMVRRMAMGPVTHTRSRLTKHEIREFMERYSEPVFFAASLFSKWARNISQATVAAAWARAAMVGHDKQMLTSARNVLYDGFPAEAGPIILLRNWLLMSKLSASGGALDDVYQKSQRALKAYLDGEKLNRLHSTDADLFPLGSLAS